jgi:tetratricopeptide (TPR) repeat protein
MRRHDEALEAVRKARRLDPLSPPLRFGLTFNRLFAGRYEEAAQSAQATLDLMPEYWMGYYHLGYVRSLQGRAFRRRPSTSRPTSPSKPPGRTAQS